MFLFLATDLGKILLRQIRVPTVRQITDVYGQINDKTKDVVPKKREHLIATCKSNSDSDGWNPRWMELFLLLLRVRFPSLAIGISYALPTKLSCLDSLEY